MSPEAGRPWEKGAQHPGRGGRGLGQDAGGGALGPAVVLVAARRHLGRGEGGVWVSYLRSGTSFYHIPSNTFYPESLKAALCSCSCASSFLSLEEHVTQNRGRHLPSAERHAD